MSEYFSDKHPITNQRRREPAQGVAYVCPCGAIVRGLGAYSLHKETCLKYKAFVARMRGKQQ